MYLLNKQVPVFVYSLSLKKMLSIDHNCGNLFSLKFCQMWQIHVWDSLSVDAPIPICEEPSCEQEVL